VALTNTERCKRYRAKKRGGPPRPHGTETHCAKGHAYDELNTRVAPNGARKCRACDRARKAETRRKARAWDELLRRKREAKRRRAA
jgi:hypothetical protein